MRQRRKIVHPPLKKLRQANLSCSNLRKTVLPHPVRRSRACQAQRHHHLHFWRARRHPRRVSRACRFRRNPDSRRRHRQLQSLLFSSPRRPRRRSPCYLQRTETQLCCRVAVRDIVGLRSCSTKNKHFFCSGGEKNLTRSRCLATIESGSSRNWASRRGVWTRLTTSRLCAFFAQFLEGPWK